MQRLFTLLLFLTSFTLANAQNVVRGPYLQSLAQTSIKVMFRTEDSLKATVAWGLQPGLLDNEMTIEEEDVNHIFLIENLTPGTTYYYQLRAEDGLLTAAGTNYRFTTSTDTQEQLSFWATGDFGEGSQNQIDVRDAFVNHVSPNYPDFWMWLGDNAYDEGTDNEFQEKVFTPPYGYEQLLTFLPFYPVPGNHDYGSINILSPPQQHRGPYYNIVEVPQNGEAGGIPSGTELYYSYDIGNTHFVALNSEVFQLTFFGGTEMQTWLQQDLSATDKLWKVVFWHQPPYSKGSHDSDDFFEVFMKAMRQHYNPVIERHGVDLVLCGHSHVYERSNLIKGHFGQSYAFNDEDNLVDGIPPYEKYLDGENPNEGTIYAVVGNSGKGTSSAELGHPVFAYEEAGSDVCGSLIVNIDGGKLTGTYLRSDGTVGEEFEIIKSYQDSSVITSLADNYIESFNIFPNPTQNEINIQISLKGNTAFDIKIIDVTGKVVYMEQDVEAINAAYQKVLSLDDLQLASGSYTIQLSGNIDGKDWAQKRIVKLD